MKKMQIEVHVLQNFAPSCLNRDDTNSPKECQFGNVRRARVSSQSWKRAMRDYFTRENLVPVGKRTKRLIDLVHERLQNSVPIEEVNKFVTEAYSKMKDTNQTAVLLFISDDEIETIASCLRDKADAKTITDRLKKAKASSDIALFGRMLAENPDRNTDAACQVAHAISTHAAEYETDFFTAVDDLKDKSKGDDAGAGMLGTQGFNSACFYRYALLDYEQLAANLAGDHALAQQTVEAFLRAFVLSIPTAKQNSHAAQSLPSFGLFIAREHGSPVSLANAFAKPVVVRREDDDLVQDSIDRLNGYHEIMGKVYGLYEDATIALFHDRMGEKAIRDHFAQFDKSTLKDALATVMDRVRGAAA